MERTHVPPQYRRRRKNNGLGCTCDCNYAKSLQGICKVIQLVLLGMAWIIIAASPYWRPIFVIGGEVWPFHVVMLFSILTWLAVFFMYVLFMSGYHLNQGHKNWPKIELYFNIGMCIMCLIAACIEAANVWRWDMRQGNIYTAGATGGSFSNYYQYGLRPGMSFTQTLNFNSYCASRPYDCSDFFSLLAGNNSYYTNHLFATVLLFFSLITFLVSTFFAYRTWRVFERDMYRSGELPKPTMWMKFTYRMEQAANHVKDRANKVLKRGNDDDDEEDDSDGDVVMEEKEVEKPPPYTESRYEKQSSRSEGRESRARSHSSHHSSHSHHTSRSHRSHHSDHRSKSRSSHRHDDDRDRHSHSSDRRSRSSSKPKSPLYEVPPAEDAPPSPVETPLSHPQPVGVFPSIGSKKGSKKGKKENGAPMDMSPVASVMI